MKIKTITARVYGEQSVFDAIQYDYTDIPGIRDAFNSWLNLKNMSNVYHGRSPNIPEWITEACLCLVTGFVRFKGSKKLKSSSFDCFDIVKERAIQAKATQIWDDLTSFGPHSKWDDLYFLDFYNDGNIDGTFSVYKIPDKLIYSCPVRRGHTLKDYQREGKRPRVSIKSQIIGSHHIKPVYFTENTNIMEHVICPSGIKPAEKGIKLW